MKKFFKTIAISTVFMTLLFSSVSPAMAANTNNVSPYLALWEDESNASSLNPKNLDQITNVNPSLNQYQNLYNGYQFSYPSDWSIDRHQIPNYSRFYAKDFRLDITLQTKKDLNALAQTSDDYINNTISSIKDDVQYKASWLARGYTMINIDYTRPEIKGLSQDLPCYSYYFVITVEGVLTFQLKTNQQNWLAHKKELLYTVLSTLSMTNTDITANETRLNSDFMPSRVSPNILQVESSNTLRIAPNQFAFGVYMPNAGAIKSLETSLQTHLGVQMFYKPITSNYDPYVQQGVNDRRIMLVTFLLQDGTNRQAPVLDKIIDGSYDNAIKSWATGIKATHSPVLVRLGNEMNANWTVWNSLYTYNDPDLYKLAFRHIVDLYREVGATNAKFVWNPNSTSSPSYAWNDATLYYPGDNYVDWVGMTAYNFGDLGGGKFKSFDQLYETLYHTYMRSFPSKPFVIPEFASVEAGGDKAQFIRDLFQKIPYKYPNLKIVNWFNAADGLYNFSIDSSSASKKAFQESLRNPNIVNYPVAIH